MPDQYAYVGLYVRKRAGDPSDPDAVWFHDHVTGGMSLKPFAGAEILDPDTGQAGEPPDRVVMPGDYADREPWVELVGMKRKIEPGGPPDDPMLQVHNLVQAKEVVLHTIHADYHYKVIQNPDRHDGQVRNYFLLELDERREPTPHDTTKGSRRTAGGEFQPLAREV